MKDLTCDELQNKFKENILYALNKKKQIDVNISFVFKGSNELGDFRFTETINYFCGNFKYKNVYFDGCLTKKDIILSIIVNNFRYDDFSYIDCIEKYGKDECHGHGEYWGTDEFTFVYKRLNSK